MTDITLNTFKTNLIDFDTCLPHLQQVTKDMTPRQMREYYLFQTDKALSEWEDRNFCVKEYPPFNLSDPTETGFFMTAEFAKKINLRGQVEAFAKEAKISTGGVRENQNVLCSWDHRYRINEYIIALLAESLSIMVKEIHPRRMANLPQTDIEDIKTNISEDARKTIESIFGMSLEEIVNFVKKNPVRIVGGEVRANTPRYTAIMTRIYAANGLYVFNMNTDKGCTTSTIFMWSYLTYMLGLSGGDFFTSSHGAPQKMSDKILAFDGAQYLPDVYEKIVEKMWIILDKIESSGYQFRLSAARDPHIMRNLDYDNTAKLYADYLRMGPASEKALDTIKEAANKGLRLNLDFFGGAGYKTLSAIFKELNIFNIFENGLIRTNEDPFFHNIGFSVAEKKNTPGELEVIHLSVDASIPKVVASASYDTILKGAPDGQTVFNVDPDADRFVGCQLLPASAMSDLQELGILYNVLEDGRLLALFSPNQLFLMIMHNDMIQSKIDGNWDNYSNFDIHTYVSAIFWDEWAEYYSIPVIRVPVGFKEIAAIERIVENSLKESRGASFTVSNELNHVITLSQNPKLHHAGEESGGKIGGPRKPIYNVLGEFIIAMREKSSGEACVSAVSLLSRLYLESKSSGDISKLFLHNYLREIFNEAKILNMMESRGDIIHYNEAIIDPDELAKAKQEGLAQRDLFNSFFRDLGLAYKSGITAVTREKLPLETVKNILSEAIPVMKNLWNNLEDIYVWSDGLQFWFEKGLEIRDICLRPSGTDAKSKVYFDGTDKEKMNYYFKEGFAKVKGDRSELYRKHIVSR